MDIIHLSGKYSCLYCLIDDEDFEKVSKYKWYLSCIGNIVRNRKYKNKIPDNLPINISGIILGKKKGLFIDHVNRDKFNNCKSNLRYCTITQNNFNRGIKKDNTSGYKGIYWHKLKNLKGKWRARISINNKRFHLGLFDDIKKAVKVYNKACKKYHGDFAVLNKV